MLCTSVSNDVSQPCKHAWKHTMIPCIVPYQRRGYNGFGEKIRFWGAWAERQHKKGNPAKSVAFKACKKPKRQRKRGKSLKFAAFPPRSRGKRQRKKGNPAKFVAFKAGKKLKRQRKKGNPAKFAAFKAGKKPKRQRKKGKTPKSVASPPTSPSPTTLHFQAPHKFPKSL